MTFSPLTSFCSRVAAVTNAAFLLSLPELPTELGNRDDIYLEACGLLNGFFDNGEIDDYFHDYLSMHLDYAFHIGGSHD
jgi:hypothetical protein